jgi:hypothetical protein
MRVLLGFAALAAIISSPAQAVQANVSIFGASKPEPWASPPQVQRYRDLVRVHRRGDHRSPGAYSPYWYAGYGGYDFDGNRSFDPQKWNDWWHDRPDRAYPRWMNRNQDCARRWYSGDVLTC